MPGQGQEATLNTKKSSPTSHFTSLPDAQHIANMVLTAALYLTCCPCADGQYTATKEPLQDASRDYSISGVLSSVKLRLRSVS